MKLFLSGASLLCAGLLFAGGSLTESRVSIAPPQKITLAWTMDSAGSVNATSDYVRGKMSRVVLYPGTAGWTNAVTLKDASGVDLLASQGASIVTGTTYNLIPGTFVSTAGQTNLVPGPVVNDRLVLGITSGGTNNAKTGTLIIYCE